MNEIITEFNIALDKVMQNIEKGEEIQARFIFNSEVFLLYDKKINDEPLIFALPFWIALNEYLNSDNIRIHKLETATKNYLLSEYEEYKADFKEAKKKNK